MGKRNKIRYQSTPKEKKTLTLTGRVFLKYEDEEEEIDRAVRGDLLVYPCHELDNILRQVGYRGRGHAGYFKLDVFEGNVWCLVLVNAIFPHREHHFSKTEYPIDTFARLGDILVGMEGRRLERSYREHYQPAEEGAAAEEGRPVPPKPPRRQKKRDA